MVYAIRIRYPYFARQHAAFQLRELNQLREGIAREIGQALVRYDGLRAPSRRSQHQFHPEIFKSYAWEIAIRFDVCEEHHFGHRRLP